MQLQNYVVLPIWSCEQKVMVLLYPINIVIESITRVIFLLATSKTNHKKFPRGSTGHQTSEKTIDYVVETPPARANRKNGLRQPWRR